MWGFPIINPRNKYFCVPMNFARYKNGTCERRSVGLFAKSWLLFTDRHVYLIRKTIRTNNNSPKYNIFTVKNWFFDANNYTLGPYYLHVFNSLSLKKKKTKSKDLMKILLELCFEILCTMPNINIKRLAEKVCKRRGKELRKKLKIRTKGGW